MFTRMLVPLDGSERAEQALAVAARLARALDSTLILVRVVQPPIQPATSLAPPLDVEGRILSEELDEATRYLAQIAQRSELAGLKHERESLVGYPSEMILEAVHASRADVIILCSHGRTGLLRWMLGSVAQRIVHQASVPVLVLQQQGPMLLSDTQRPLRVLAPLDGSWLAEAALAPAVTLVSALAPQGQGSVHLVQVVRPPGDAEARQPASSGASTREAGLLEAEDYLRRVAEQLNNGPLASLRVQITWTTIANKDVAGTLVDLAKRGKAAQGTGGVGGFDLIAMATHGRGGLHRWVMGSVTERVLSVSRVPMLVIRPKEVIFPSRLNTALSQNQNETTIRTQKGLEHA
ncbi:MAG TPA: universal stress protein [Ktedonobacterales bacterium]|nr:universal stress protein [Ktedonobacterales bacterium]